MATGTSRIVVVTGGESCIGAACARAFGAAGDRVAVFPHSDAGDISVRIAASGGTAIGFACAVDGSVAVEAACVTGATFEIDGGLLQGPGA